MSRLAEVRAQAGPSTTITAPIRWEPEARAGGEGRRVVGHAAVFDSPTVIAGRFRERVAPGAFRNVLARRPAVPLVWNHDQGALLASTKNGSLVLREDSRGLRVEATLSGTSLAADVLTLIRENLADSMSFAFSIQDEDWREGGDLPERIIREVGTLADVSVVTSPAYQDAEIALAEARARRTLAERIDSVTGRRRPRIEVGETRSAYGEQSEHSYFADMWVIAHHNRAQNPPLGAPGWAVPLPSHHQGGIDQVRARFLAEQRDSTTASIGAMAGQDVSGLPGFIRDAYGAAARSRMRFASAIPTEPLGPGVRVDIPRIRVGVSAGTMVTENTALTEQDMVTHAGTLSPVCTASGLADVSQQAADWSAAGGRLDLVLAAELGGAVGSVVEQQVVNGTATNGQTRGLLSWSGTSSYVAGTVSVDSNWSRIVNMRQSHDAAWGLPPDLYLVHPRRLAYLEQGAGTLGVLPWRGDVLLSTELPTNYGSGGTQDVVLAMNRDQVALYARPELFRPVIDWSGSGALTMRFACHRFFALGIKAPAAVSCLSGVGLGTPTFA